MAVVMKRKREKIPSKKEAERAKSNETKIVTVVGLGASAGGLEAFEHFVKHVPAQGRGIVRQRIHFGRVNAHDDFAGRSLGFIIAHGLQHSRRKTDGVLRGT